MTLRIRLSDRERQVLELVLEGLTFRLIGERLGINEKTVNAHVQAVAGRIPGAGRPLVKLVRHGKEILAA